MVRRPTSVGCRSAWTSTILSVVLFGAGAGSASAQDTPVSGLNYIWWRVMTDAIRGDPDWKGGMYETQPTRWHSAAPLLFGMADSSLRLQRIAPTNAESQTLFDDMLERARKAFGDANDFLYAFEASWDYDPTPLIGKIKARLLALNFADDVINPAEIGAVEAAVANIPGARSVLMQPSALSIGPFEPRPAGDMEASLGGIVAAAALAAVMPLPRTITTRVVYESR